MMINDKVYRRNFVWNVIGSLSNALSSFILLLIVNRILAEYEGGLFSIGFATAQLMAIIGCFEVRAFQSTDVSNKYTFDDYYLFRIVTCSVMIIASVFFIFMKGYDNEKAIIVFLLCVYRMVDSLADVFEGLFQVNNRLDLTGKALTIRVIISTTTLFITLLLFRNLIISLILMCIMAYLSYYIYAKRKANTMIDIREKSSLGRIKNLFVECLPLFIASFLHMYIINAPKYCIDVFMSSEDQNLFTIIFMPAFVINLLCIFLLRPSVVDIAEIYKKRDIAKLNQRINKLCLSVVVIGIICIIGMRFVGMPVLSNIYNIDLHNYSREVVIIMIGGLFNAIATVFYYVLTIIRVQRKIAIIYLITVIITAIISIPLVSKYNLLGASITSTISMFLIMIQSVWLSYSMTSYQVEL